MKPHYEGQAQEKYLAGKKDGKRYNGSKEERERGEEDKRRGGGGGG